MNGFFISYCFKKLVIDDYGTFSLFWKMVPLIIDLGEIFVCLQFLQGIHFNPSLGLGSSIDLVLRQGTKV